MHLFLMFVDTSIAYKKSIRYTFLLRIVSQMLGIGCFFNILYVQGDNARQRATLIPGALPDVEMCLTLPHIQKLKKNFSMELTIIETSAY